MTVRRTPIEVKRTLPKYGYFEITDVDKTDVERDRLIWEYLSELVELRLGYLELTQSPLNLMPNGSFELWQNATTPWGWTAAGCSEDTGRPGSVVDSGGASRSE